MYCQSLLFSLGGPQLGVLSFTPALFLSLSTGYTASKRKYSEIWTKAHCLLEPMSYDIISIRAACHAQIQGKISSSLHNRRGNVKSWEHMGHDAFWVTFFGEKLCNKILICPMVWEHFYGIHCLPCSLLFSLYSITVRNLFCIKSSRFKTSCFT